MGVYDAVETVRLLSTFATGVEYTSMYTDEERLRKGRL